jgi:hypothetical protein
LLVLAVVQWGWAKRLSLPLLGIELESPPGFSVSSAAPSRVILLHRSAPMQISVYKVEFGNLSEWTPAHEAQLVKILKSRLGRGGTATVGPASLGKESGRGVRVAGQRNGTAYALHAAWHFRGGQAWVVETMFPETSRTSGEDAHSAVLRSFLWLSPDRG